MAAEPHFHVIFRTCDVVRSVHGTRPFNLEKRPLIQECFYSLWTALRPYSHSIEILGDKVSPELEAWFGKFQAVDSGITFSNGNYGNDESIRQSVLRALARPDDDWVYLCEDDYLHVPQAFEWIHELIVNRDQVLKTVPRRSFMGWFFGDLTKKPLILHPADYPDRYKADHRTLSWLFLTKHNHWRQIANTTFTILAQGKTFQRYRTDLLKSSKGADDDYLSHRVMERFPYRGRALCLSPIPGIASHMHAATMTPLVDWEAVHREWAAKVADLEVRGLS